jgi:hypothetical protein
MHYCHISLQFCTFSIYSMVTCYPILFIVWLRNTLFFIQHYIIRELFKVFVVFSNKFDFLTGITSAIFHLFGKHARLGHWLYIVVIILGNIWNVR